MNKKQRKGFTLVELVAVLVILAILAAIVTPLVLTLIRKSRIASYKRSIDAYGKAVEISIMNELLDTGMYPNDLTTLKVEYTGDEVVCNVMQIKTNGGIYLSECTVDGEEVKDSSTDDGWYHYGQRDISDEEYVDMYGSALTRAVSTYNETNNKLPEDYTTLELDYKGKEVSCDVTINYDGSIYLTKCSIDNKEVKSASTEDGYYHYGEIRIAPGITTLLSKANDASVTTYTTGSAASHEMYTFSHTATTQTESLTDYRYIGSDPYNYVTFNDEVWRIIGVFTVEGENGTKEQRIKIIKNASSDQAWASSDVNEWTTASLNTYLNGTYYNSLSSEAQSMIAPAKFYLGARSYDGTTHYGTATDIYAWERGTTVISGRSTNWIGKIALLYPSDYVYTYANGVDSNCYTDVYTCRTDKGGSPSNGWLYNGVTEWTIAPHATNAAYVLHISKTGAFGSYNANSTYSTRPVTYLNSDVKIIDGDGSETNPYQLQVS